MHPRGTVFVEFAVMAPLAVMLMCFAFDMTRILRLEQQLEIGARAMADLETHWAKEKYDGGPEAQKKGESPSKKSKQIVKKYLATTIPGLKEEDCYCKKQLNKVAGPSAMIATFCEFFSGGLGEDVPAIVRMISKVFEFLMDVITLKTHRYLTEIPPRDQIFKVSFTARLATLMPRKFYNVMGLALGDRRSAGEQLAVVSQLRQKMHKDSSGPGGMKLIEDERERFWCAMPMMDTAVQPPLTYSRQIKGIFKRYLPKWLQEMLF